MSSRQSPGSSRPITTAHRGSLLKGEEIPDRGHDRRAHRIDLHPLDPQASPTKLISRPQAPPWDASHSPLPCWWSLVVGAGFGQQGRRPGPLIPGTRGQDLAHEGGPPARVTGLGGDIGPLSAWGDELPGQVR